MPHFGHLPGAFDITSGCIGQTNAAAVVGCDAAGMLWLMPDMPVIPDISPCCIAPASDDAPVGGVASGSGFASACEGAGIGDTGAP